MTRHYHGCKAGLLRDCTPACRGTRRNKRCQFNNPVKRTMGGRFNAWPQCTKDKGHDGPHEDWFSETW